MTKQNVGVAWRKEQERKTRTRIAVRRRKEQKKNAQVRLLSLSFSSPNAIATELKKDAKRRKLPSISTLKVLCLSYQHDTTGDLDSKERRTCRVRRRILLPSTDKCKTKRFDLSKVIEGRHGTKWKRVHLFLSSSIDYDTHVQQALRFKRRLTLTIEFDRAPLTRSYKRTSRDLRRVYCSIRSSSSLFALIYSSFGRSTSLPLVIHLFSIRRRNVFLGSNVKCDGQIER